MSIAIGSRWKERDNRFHRVVEVVSEPSGNICDPRVAIRTVEFTSTWAGKPVSRKLSGLVTYAKVSAFGKRYRAIDQ